MKSIQTYFSPLSSALYSNTSRWETTQIGRSIDSHIEDSFPNIKFAEIAVFNIPEYIGSKNSSSPPCGAL